MEFLLDLLFIYIAVYSIYFLALSFRNLKDKPFKIEKRYSQYENKARLALIIYSHNNKANLEHLVEQIKLQEYPIDSFKVFAILDNCTDGSELVFQNNSFISVVDLKNKETLGKDKSVSLVLEQLKNNNWIDAYVFIDGNRNISNNFLTTVNSALINNSVLSGETLMRTDNLDIIDSIKAVYQKYHMNFIRKARSLFGLASQADSGVFIIKKQIVDSIGAVDFKDIDSELKYSLLLSKIGFKCTYNPNIQTYVNSEGYVFQRPRLSNRLKLFFSALKQLFTKNFVFTEHVLSLISPNFWLVLLSYMYLMKHSYKYYFFVDFKIVLLGFLLWTAGFGISLINSKLNVKEVVLLILYPIYSVCHIIKNFPPIRKIVSKVGGDSENKFQDKLSIDVVVATGKNELPCKLEFISDRGACKVRFIFKNKKYTTDSHLRMIDALQELKSKLDDYGFVLKICNCCSHFQSSIDGSTYMLKGICKCDYPSITLKEPRSTLIWNSCTKFTPKKLNSLIEEMVARGSTAD